MIVPIGNTLIRHIIVWQILIKELPGNSDAIIHNMMNAVLRERFDVDAKNMAIVSRIIKATIEAGFIELSDENVALKSRRYIPYWA